MQGVDIPVYSFPFSSEKRPILPISVVLFGMSILNHAETT
jgi:hypothetical protein